jgi:hypothetical protein
VYLFTAVHFHWIGRALKDVGTMVFNTVFTCLTDARMYRFRLHRYKLRARRNSP